MIARLKPYPTTKDSGIKWLGEVPAHWEVRRLRNVSQLRVSNVDKHSKEDEASVRLCNYVDVYKNDHIRSGMAFMPATAKADEFDRFRLCSGDVLITKDSEAWNDIAVPALVQNVDADVVSGYHLALLRPDTKQLGGTFLFRAMQSRGVAHQFHVEAKGVTRYGLSHDAIKSVQLPVPPLPEQTAIARFLDHADRRIQRYIRAKEKLIALMEEQKQAIIHQAVTGQIDARTGQPYQAYKPTGVDQFSRIPIHWHVLRTRFVLREVDVRSRSGREPSLSMSQVLGLVPSHRVDRTLTAASNIGGKLCETGDLVLNRLKAHLGVFALARHSGLVSSDYSVFRVRNTAQAEYLELVLKSPAIRKELRIRAKGIVEGFWRLYTGDLFDIRLPVPPVPEQQAIAEAIAEMTSQCRSQIGKNRDQVDLLREYRTRLIADVATGKLDVREAAAALPKVDPFADEDEVDDSPDTGNAPAVDQDKQPAGIAD